MKRTFPEKIRALKKLYKERLLPGAKSVLNDGKNIILDKNLINIIMLPYNTQPETSFSKDSKIIFEEILKNSFSAIVGRNNTGKSFVLRQLKGKIGEDALYLGPNRYQNFSTIGSFMPNQDEKKNIHQNFLNLPHNIENSDNQFVQLQTIILGLKTTQRGVLFEIISKLFGVTVEAKHIDEENDESQKYISCNGVNMSYMSSGFRLSMFLVAALLDDKYHTFLIDEPELGISPELQAKLAEFFLDKEKREKYFSHIKNLVFATHSSIFLDSSDIGNNYMLEKKGNEISLMKTGNWSEFHNIHFFLLGNRFETLFLPSAIVLVEGPTDKDFLDAVFAKRFPDKKFSVLFGNNDGGGDGKIVNLAHRMKDILNISNSPYNARTFVVFDAKNSGKKGTVVNYGYDERNITTWQKNGIEYCFPERIMDNIFGKGGDLNINKDKSTVTRNSIEKTKTDLTREVISRLESNSEFSGEFEDFLKKFENL